MGADAEPHSPTLGKARATPQRGRGITAGATGVEDARRTRPKELTKQGS